MLRHLRTTIGVSITAIAMSALLLAQDVKTDNALAEAKTIYSQQGPRAALPAYEKVLDAYRKLGDRRGEAITTGLIGNCYKRLGNYPKALELLNAALQIKREIHDRPEQGKTLSHLGLVYWEQGDYAKAIEKFGQSIAIARELKDLQLEAASLNNLSLVYDEQGDYRKSLEQYQRALDLHRSVNYEPGESDTLGNIGGVYLLLGRYSEAEKHYREALEISRRLKLAPSETQDLGNLAQCLLGEGKIKESIEIYEEAIAIAGHAGMAKEEADWYRGKASALLRLGKFDVALSNYELARETYAKGGLKRELTEVLNDTGYAYLELGDRMRAQREFQQAINASRAIGFQRGVVINQLALAEVFLHALEYLRATKNVELALAGARKLDDSAQIVNSQMLIARILLDQHHSEKAYDAASQAQSLARRDGLRLMEVRALDLLGESLIQSHRPGDAMTALDAAKALAAESGDVDALWMADYHRGQSLEILKRYEEAIEAFKASVAAIEEVRAAIKEQPFRTGYLQDKQKVYLALVRLFLRLGRTAEAFSYSERLREFSYLNLLNGSIVIASTQDLAEVGARIRLLQQSIETESARPQAQQRSQALRIYSEGLLDAQRQYASLIASSRSGNGSIRRVDATEIARALPLGTALLEYVVDENQVTTFVVTNAGLQVATTRTSEQNLLAKIQLLRDLMVADDGDRWAKPAQSLYSILISPLSNRGFLKGISTLIIVPHSTLNYLPFAILPVETAGRLRFLVEKYAIATLPAAALALSARRNSADSAGHLLAVAPPRSGLPFAIEEARSVGKMFSPDSDVLVSKNATETRFKQEAGHYQFIHLATHGFFNKTNPLFSGLRLEPDADDDGRLEVHEILQLRLNARLVTLSACDTALGSGDFAEMPAGDEFVALDRAFLEAGSDAVLASLWKVNDRSTLIIMNQLYQDLRTTSGPKALAQAQRAMIRDPRFRQPYHWGAFTFVGKDFGSVQNLAESN
jgi:CHAT domain-containing protein/Tfp pilus assembly protein PilF